MNEEQKETRKSSLISRNIAIFGRRTSVRLEPEMWRALREIARREECKIHDICSLISLRKKPGTSLTAAIRVFLMLYFKAAATENGHQRAGHGDFRNMLARARMAEDALQRPNNAARMGRIPVGRVGYEQPHTISSRNGAHHPQKSHH